MLVCCGFVYDLTFWKRNFWISLRGNLLSMMFCRDQFSWIFVAYISGRLVLHKVNYEFCFNFKFGRLAVIFVTIYFIPFNPLMSPNTQTPHLRSEGLQKFGCVLHFWVCVLIDLGLEPSHCS